MRRRIEVRVQGGRRKSGRRRMLRIAARLLIITSISYYGGCRTQPPVVEEVQGVRVSDALYTGDAARRASVRLVVQGLDADSRGQSRRARGSYERAVQVDPTNPYAYLALARYHLDGDNPREAANFIDQAAAFFEVEGMRSSEVDVHLIGLRGWLFESRGRTGEAAPYLDRAAALEPEIWGDGYLSARELR